VDPAPTEAVSKSVAALAADDARATRRLRTIEELPGPRGWPILGNLPQIRKSRLHQALEAWRQRYGDYFQIQLGRRRFLVVADPQAITAMLRDRPEGFRRNSLMETIGAEMGINGVFGANGEAWIRQRRLVMAAFTPAKIKSYFPSLAQVSARLLRRWRQAAARNTPIDLRSDLMRYTVDVTAGLAFGADINTLESESERIQQHLDQVFPMLQRRLLAPFPYWRYFRLPVDRRLDRHLAVVHAAVAEFIRAARVRLSDPERRANPRNLIEAMLVERDRPDSDVSDQEVAGNMLTMLLAGEDTTANSLAWTIYLLRQNPAAEQRLRAELKEVLGSCELPDDSERLARLKYAEACASEAMRLKPVAPFQPAEANRDTQVGDVRVPKGSVVFGLARPNAVDERYFPEAHAFRPERWLSGDGRGAGERISIPFGAGPRICPGRYLALQEMKLVLAMLFGNFQIASLTGDDGEAIEEELAFTMSPSRLILTLSTGA
jgi:cytochrome P450